MWPHQICRAAHGPHGLKVWVLLLQTNRLLFASRTAVKPPFQHEQEKNKTASRWIKARKKKNDKLSGLTYTESHIHTGPQNQGNQVRQLEPAPFCCQGRTWGVRARPRARVRPRTPPSHSTTRRSRLRSRSRSVRLRRSRCKGGCTTRRAGFAVLIYTTDPR